MHKKSQAQLAKSLYHAHLQRSYENNLVLETCHISVREGEVAFTLDADGERVSQRSLCTSPDVEKDGFCSVRLALVSETNRADRKVPMIHVRRYNDQRRRFSVCVQ